MMTLNEIAAIIHLDMVEDDANGYDQVERYGEPGNYKELEIDGRTYRYQRGDRDCSSSVCEAWALALWHTPYAGLLDGATYTGNMRSVFVSSGLFEVWDTANTSAETGDIYLRDMSGGHAAMCQSPANPDTLSQFSGNEFDGITGGERGDQTGWEGHVRDFYGGWDCTLHYNHKADNSFIDGGGEPDPTPPTKRKHAKYRVMVDWEWCPLMVDLTDTGGSDDNYAGVIGKPIQYLAVNCKKYRVMTRESIAEYEAGRAKTKWLDWVSMYNLKDLVNGAAGDGSEIVKVEIRSKNVRFSVHSTDGKWRKQRGYIAGDGVHAIDAIRIKHV